MTAHASPADEFTDAIITHAPRYEVQLAGSTIARLRDYYELVNAWNSRLHLVAPCSPTEFATRHILESLLALPFITGQARVADVGSGAGLPIIPCLIKRPDIQATLFEASPKKAIFLREALRHTRTHERAKVLAERFEKTTSPEVDFVTCRALDRFAEMFPKLLAWSPPTCRLLLFGGPALREQIESAARAYTALRIPRSEQRFLYVVAPGSL